MIITFNIVITYHEETSTNPFLYDKNYLVAFQKITVVMMMMMMMMINMIALFARKECICTVEWNLPFLSSSLHSRSFLSKTFS